MKNDNSYIQVKGRITEVLPNTKFKVLLENGLETICTISGKMRINNIRVLQGDEVIVDVSTYDLSKGRIKTRL